MIAVYQYSVNTQETRHRQEKQCVQGECLPELRFKPGQIQTLLFHQLPLYNIYSPDWVLIGKCLSPGRCLLNVE